VFERVVLVHYHEIGLKGRNRASFEDRLRVNLKSAVHGLTTGRVRRIASRVLVEISDHAHREELLAAVAQTPGVSHVGDALVTSREYGEIFAAADRVLREAGPFKTFRVTARRSATDHPVSSGDMNVAIGAHIQEATGAPVDLSNPDVTVHVEVVQGEAYVFARRVEGIGGLPTGTAGKVVALLSSGLDSPVAAWRMMRRGAVVIGLHFSGEPQTSDASARAVVELGRILERSGGLGRIYVVPFGDLQREIMLGSPQDLRVILYRRLMVRVGEALAKQEAAKALVTGESLGQVASQTLENIAAVDAVTALPILRPLIGSDKREIVDEARKIGTFDASTATGEDCCTLFMPRNPATHATVAQADAGEAELDMESLVERSLAGMRHYDFRCPSYRAPKGQRDAAATDAVPAAPVAGAAPDAAETPGGGER
jgi:tRNA uracil 4-sulfurtransferase